MFPKNHLLGSIMVVKYTKITISYCLIPYLFFSMTIFFKAKIVDIIPPIAFSIILAATHELPVKYLKEEIIESILPSLMENIFVFKFNVNCNHVKTFCGCQINFLLFETKAEFWTKVFWTKIDFCYASGSECAMLSLKSKSLPS